MKELKLQYKAKKDLAFKSNDCTVLPIFATSD